jgi:hypothetical protein
MFFFLSPGLKSGATMNVGLKSTRIQTKLMAMRFSSGQSVAALANGKEKVRTIENVKRVENVVAVTRVKALNGYNAFSRHYPLLPIYREQRIVPRRGILAIQPFQTFKHSTIYNPFNISNPRTLSTFILLPSPLLNFSDKCYIFNSS